MRETIEIDFEEKFQTTIPCIEKTTSDKYSVYLAIISGEVLAALYEEYRDRLLEKNVRSFRQVKGGVNKGIRDTLRETYPGHANCKRRADNSFNIQCQN